MNILGMGTLEILVILLVAFIFLGPERMVDAARFLGKVVRDTRRMTTELPDFLNDKNVDDALNTHSIQPVQSQNSETEKQTPIVFKGEPDSSSTCIEKHGDQEQT